MYLEEWLSDFLKPSFEELLASSGYTCDEHPETLVEVSDLDGDSGAMVGCVESSLLLVFLDFVECCFKKSARAGRGNGTGRLCGVNLPCD